MDISEIIVKKALNRLGYKETKGNSGWEDKNFQLEMEMTGWSTGQSWCAYFLESVWCKAYANYDSSVIPVLRKLFSANAVATWDNFSNSKFITSDTPVVGAGVIWMNMKSGIPNYLTTDKKWIAGHAGIVKEINETSFTTIEGNGNQSGGREGIEVASLNRSYSFNNKNGLKLLGFVHPKI
jgi:hypothetical protein